MYKKQNYVIWIFDLSHLLVRFSTFLLRQKRPAVYVSLCHPVVKRPGIETSKGAKLPGSESYR